MFGRFALAAVLLGCGSSSSPSPNAQSGSAIEGPPHDARPVDARTSDAPVIDAADTSDEPPEPPGDPADDDMACSPDDPRCTGPLENVHKRPVGSRK